jgi:signal transduction histidine kinase
MNEITTRTADEQSAVKVLEEKLERKEEAFTTLFNLFRKLRNASDPENVVGVFGDILRSRVGYRKIAFYLHRPGAELIEPYHAAGEEREKLPGLTPFSPFLSWLAEWDDFIDIEEFPGYRTEEDCRQELSALLGNGYRSALSIREGREVVGVIFFSAKNGSAPENDRHLDEIVYRTASILIRAVWLHRETERSKLELERFSEVKKRFIGHTSHELRTPLTVVKSAVDSIEGRESDRELISMARDAVDNLQSTVEMLLSYNDLELRKHAFDMVLTDVASIVKDCIRELAADFEENDVAMSIENRAGRVLALLDRSKIRLVFKSLIENALNYVEENGRVDIELLVCEEEPSEEEGVELKDLYPALDSIPEPPPDYGEEETAGLEQKEPPCRDSSSYFVCRIGDNGIGIPESEIAYISEPFRMASNSPLKGVRGLGMGLTISQRIIAGHGGKLFCRSGEDAGSIFSVWIPVSR